MCVVRTDMGVNRDTQSERQKGRGPLLSSLREPAAIYLKKVLVWFYFFLFPQHAAI